MTGRIAFLQHSASDTPGLLRARAEELGLATASHRADHGLDALPAADAFDLLVVMGSVASVTDATVPWLPAERDLVARAVDRGTPVLGVCFGGQLLADVLGGTVAKAVRPEIGWRTLETDDPARVPAGPWLVWHEDAFTLPPGAEALARTDVSLHAFVAGPHTGVQFHPEVTYDVVQEWIADARDGDRLAAEHEQELVAGFDGWDDVFVQRTYRLFDGFLARAGRTV
jgi:GMP synthase-like glutamine amidotransferase